MKENQNYGLTVYKKNKKKYTFSKVDFSLKKNQKSTRPMSKQNHSPI